MMFDLGDGTMQELRICLLMFSLELWRSYIIQT